MSPDGAEGGIWQSGRGPSVDPDGAIYFEAGNGSFNGATDFGTSLLKLSVGGNGLSIDDYFTPHDFEALNARDADLGSTGPMLVPGTHLLVAGSKKGILYLFDTRKLGQLTPDDSGALQAFENNGGRLLAGTAYWDGPAARTLYVWCEADVLKAYRFEGERIITTPFAKGAVGSRGSPGGALTVSADGRKSGTGIVWGTLTASRSADHGNAAGVLRAFDAETLQELWNSEQQSKRDRLGTLVKFNPPDGDRRTRLCAELRQRSERVRPAAELRKRHFTQRRKAAKKIKIWVSFSPRWNTSAAAAPRTSPELISWPSHLPATLRRTSAAISSSDAPGAHQPLHVVFLDREQAVAQLAVRRQPQAIAVQAERPAHRRDEAHPPAAVRVSVLRGRRARIGIRHRRRAARSRARASRSSRPPAAPCSRSHRFCASSGMNSM